MALARIIRKSLLKTSGISKTFPVLSYQVALISTRERAIIGKREVVGFGYNGQPNYCDRVDYPFPAIRWKEPSCEIEALREKEQDDWQHLTCEEKKLLYRASFCQTYSEFLQHAPHQWQRAISGVLLLICPALWLYYAYKAILYPELLPHTYCEEHRQAMFRRILDLHVNPIQGVASKWDYERDTWKK